MHLIYVSCIFMHSYIPHAFLHIYNCICNPCILYIYIYVPCITCIHIYSMYFMHLQICLYITHASYTYIYDPCISCIHIYIPCILCIYIYLCPFISCICPLILIFISFLQINFYHAYIFIIISNSFNIILNLNLI